MPDILQQALFAFLLTLGLLVALSRLAPRIGLMDEPNHRKPHSGSIPLVGGLAVFLSVLAVAVIWGADSTSDLGVDGRMVGIALTAGGVLVAVGVWDDLRGLSVLPRVALEVMVALVVIEGIDLKLQNLGDLVGAGPVLMPEWFSYIFLVIAIFGIINAYNMLDGMDGLLTINVLITLVMFFLTTAIMPGLVVTALCASLLAFLVSNFSLWKPVPKTFLGDAGSKFLGLMVVCILIAAASSQFNNKLIAPVTALYVAGLPLMDMVYVTLRRAVRGRSPFRADRDHIHHLMLALGLGKNRSLALICSTGCALPLLGLMLHLGNMAENIQFSIYLGCFALYYLLVGNMWIVGERLMLRNEQDAALAEQPLETPQHRTPGLKVVATVNTPLGSSLAAPD